MPEVSRVVFKSQINALNIMETSCSFNVFLMLPSGVVHDILMSWLQLESVGKLDTAYCATQQRARFVEMCQEKVVVFTLTPTTEKVDIYMKWIIARNFKISNACSIVHFEIFKKLLMVTGKHFKTLTLSDKRYFELVGLYCPDLKHLKLTYSASESFRAVLIGCPLLESLEIGYGDMFDKALWLDGISCPMLSTLTIKAANNRQLAAIAKSCHNLTSLDCTFHAIVESLTEEGAQALANSPISLRSLKIQLYMQSSVPVSFLSIVKITLVSIALFAVPLAERDFVQLVNNGPNIKEVSLHNMKISDLSLEVIATELPKLTKFELVHCSGNMEIGLSTIAKKCEYLQHLNLCGNENTAEASLLSFAQNCSQLRSINVDENFFVSDAFLLALSAHNPELNELSAGKCGKVTDEGMCTLVKQCAHLTKLSLCSNITDATMFGIAECSRHLVELDLACSLNVTELGLLTVLQRCNKLRTIFCSKRFYDHIHDSGVITTAWNAQLVRSAKV